MESTRIGFLGFGEVGRRFAADLRAGGAQRALATYDLLLHQAAAGEGMRRHAAAQRVDLLTDASGLAESSLIFSAVTAAQTRAAAQSLCARPLGETWVVDLNSASPDTKIECAALVAAAGGRYVEAAVMTSVPPHGIRVPMLLGGPHAAACEPVLRTLGFVATAVSDQLGIASAIKLCRSVIIKGLEALVVESFTAARAFGVEREVLASLQETYPQFDWEKQGDYLFSRVIQHGRRRSEEMQASAEMIDTAGVGGVMAAAAAFRQAGVATLKEAGVFEQPTEQKAWRDRADAILKLVPGGGDGELSRRGDSTEPHERLPISPTRHQP
ncbi:MAG TPA: DUF1932 domain-containing protein [Steroidobacteraceae bacterium]|nr:DUF1932 domain-containing protein [Steroidobacteraceae bacterium]